MAHIFDVAAAAHAAVQSVLKAAPSVNYISYPKLRAENGTRYGSRGFNESGQALGARCKFIWRNTLAKRTCGVFPRSAQDIICFAAHKFARFYGAEAALAKAFVDCSKNIVHSELGSYLQ